MDICVCVYLCTRLWAEFDSLMEVYLVQVAIGALLRYLLRPLSPSPSRLDSKYWTEIKVTLKHTHRRTRTDVHALIFAIVSA